MQIICQLCPERILLIQDFYDKIMKNPLNAVLSDIEKLKLEQLSQDNITLGALRKVFLFGIYYNGTLKKGENPNPLLNFALSLDKENVRTNEQLGAVLRAAQEGIWSIETAFKEIEQFKPTETPVKNEKNPAR